MTFIFHPEAEVEFVAATDYYENREVGLGYDFSTEVFAAIQPHREHFYWPDLDVDLTLETIEHPERFPLKAK